MRFAMCAALVVLAACGRDNASRHPDHGHDLGTTDTAVGTGAGTGSVTGTGTGTDAHGIELGFGVNAHAAATPGQPALVFHGEQGGWHIDLSGSVVGLGSIIGLETWADRVDTGTRVATNGESRSNLQLAGYDDATRTGWFAGEKTLVPAPNGWADICPLDGVEVQLCAKAEDLADPGSFADSCLTASLSLSASDRTVCASGTPGTGTGTGTGTTSTP